MCTTAATWWRRAGYIRFGRSVADCSPSPTRDGPRVAPMAPRPIGTDDGPARTPGPLCVPGQGVPHGMVLPAAGRRVRDRLRDRPEIHRRLHTAVAERGARGRGRGQPVAADP